jgi:hypothetical protein
VQKSQDSPGGFSQEWRKTGSDLLNIVTAHCADLIPGYGDMFRFF